MPGTSPHVGGSDPEEGDDDCYEHEITHVPVLAWTVRWESGR